MAKCPNNLHNGSAPKAVPCVYCIRSNVSNDLYIGSTRRADLRFTFHRSHLNLMDHSNNKMIGHVKEYGLDSLDFIILEECLEADLKEVEQWFYDNMEPSFNINGPLYKKRVINSPTNHGNEGCENGNAKLTIDQVIEIRGSFDTCSKLSREYNISPSQVWMVRNYKSYKNIKHE